LEIKYFPVNSLFNREIEGFSNRKTGPRENGPYFNENRVLCCLTKR
jgi:hypothetical protein